MEAGIFKLNVVSNDDRRTLAEFGEKGNWKVAKVLFAKKESCVVGDHYHKGKDECFLLLSGHANVVLQDDNRMQRDVDAPAIIQVPRNTYHAFSLTSGSVLIGLASELHDPSDDYKL